MRPETEAALDELTSLFPLKEGRSDAFVEAVSKIALLGDPAAIPAILDLADERCQLGGLMRSLMDSLEIYPSEEFVPRFLSALPGFAQRNPGLARTAVAKLLWGPSYREIVTAMAPRLDAGVKRALRSVLLEVRAPAKEREELLKIL